MHKKIIVTLICLLIQEHLHAAQVKTAVQTEQDIFQLTLAAESGNIERLKELIESGANIHAQDASGWNVLDWAIYGEQKETINYLLNCGVGTDQGDIHIKRALNLNDKNCLDFLTKDKRIQIKEPEILAVMVHSMFHLPSYFEPLIKALFVERKFNINIQYTTESPFFGGTLLMYCSLLKKYSSNKCSSKTRRRCIKLLMMHGAEKNITNKNKQRAFDCAKTLDYTDEELLDLLS